MILSSFLYGWGFAILAGIIVGILSYVLGVPQEKMVTISTPAGVVMGILGLSIPWVRRVEFSKIYVRSLENKK